MATIVLMLAVSFNVEAQLGGALKNAKKAAETTVKDATKGKANEKVSTTDESSQSQGQADRQTTQNDKKSGEKNDKKNEGMTDNNVYPTGTDEGVVINGVKWATRNVDNPGTFVTNPSEAGKLYQWGRKVAWPAVNISKANIAGWDETYPKGDVWKNDPSPAGWRVPTIKEAQTLNDSKKVDSEWISLNGVLGRKYTDKETGNFIFVPAADGVHNTGNFGGNSQSPRGWYWTSTEFNPEQAWHWGFDMVNNFEWRAGVDRRSGEPIRPVAK